MTLKRRFFSAPTLTQALLAAARHHSAEPDAIKYEVIDKKQGFIKAPRGVVIEVDPDAPIRAELEAAPPAGATHPALEQPAPARHAAEVPFAPPAGDPPAAHPALEPVLSQGDPVEPTANQGGWAASPSEPAAAADGAQEPAPEAAESEAPSPALEVVATAESSEEEEQIQAPTAPEEPAAAAEVESLPVSERELQEAVAEAVDELAFMAALRVQTASVKLGDDGLEIELEGPDSSRLAARGGRALLAMQHLLPRLLFGRLGKAMRCHVDCDDFHAARGERLERLAQKAAERVRSGGRSWLLEPMAPDERRLVHLALSEVADIETESVGEGFLKRVRVAQTGSTQGDSA